MLKIHVDLQEEYNILVHAQIAKEGQYCFVTQDVACCDELEYVIWQWQTRSHAKKDKGLVLLTVLALSQKYQDFHHEQKNHYQTIANA